MLTDSLSDLAYSVMLTQDGERIIAIIAASDVSRLYPGIKAVNITNDAIAYGLALYGPVNRTIG